jgi:hypothetical protein
VKPDDWNTSTHEFAVPLQWSVASHAPPCEEPVQSTTAVSKTSAGQVPDVPVHVSATSHWPASVRQVKLDDWKTSTHEFAVPLQ